MDPIMMLWICLWGAIPPAVVAWWAYKQGLNSAKKSQELANAMRDEALGSVQDLRKKLDELSIPSHVRLAPEDMDSLKCSLKGILGKFVQNGLAGAEGFIENEKKELVALDPGAALQGAIMGRIMGFLGN